MAALDAFSSSLFTSLPSLSPPSRRVHTDIPTKISAVKIDDKRTQQSPKESLPIRPSSSSSTAAAKPEGLENRAKSRPSGLIIKNIERKKTTLTQPRPQAFSIPTIVCNAFDDIINNFVDPPIRPSVNPKHVLSENFAPVDELPPTECLEVEGELPPCLDGAYIRNGPNPRYLPRGPYHLFDGDGMLHSLRISGGRATLCSRYVRTFKYMAEEKAGCAVYPNVFSAFHGYGGIARGAVAAARALSGQFNPLQGVGLANTSVVLFGNRLYALGESDLPYEMRVSSDGEVHTVGRCDFDGKLFMGMTAHPKVDPDSGEVFAFRYGPVPPYLTYFRFNADGIKQPDVPIFSLGQPSMIHDFAITKRFAVFVDMQIVMNPLEMILGNGSPVGADPTKVPRIGIIPRYAEDESEMRWFEVPGFNMMHAVNAWDEEGGDAVVLIAPNLVSVEHTLERMHLLHCMVEKVRIDLKTGLVKRTPVAADNLEFGIINPSYTAKKNRYSYMAVGNPFPKASGLVKLDLEAGRGDCTVARREYGEGCYGGEVFFVARNPEDEKAEEDDGYIVSYVHDNEKPGGGESRFLVMDARSPTLEIVASVKLPARVPYGFHGLFVRESDLEKQLQWLK
ncbi:probable carotenoid cleavage dioxygenase 4, chloroplastic [Aristolochia californica]|uniref:probable carotenoid cleavage dioxygenase 4, chloroplastic n=1 Tax=Aristolochia californica TaxID=171875 RepID=UPI0035DC4EC7